MPIPVGKNAEERAKIKKWLEGRNKYPSGFCNEHGIPARSVSHEGTRPTDYKGNPMKTCHLWQTCPCECHYKLDVMFEMGEMERHEVPNPLYVRVPTQFVMPEVKNPLTGAVASSPGGVSGPDGDEEAYAPLPVADTTPLAQRRTPLGYAGRGTLEAQVWDAVTKHLDMMNLGIPITTLVISDWIATEYKVPTPSRGAIQAVWVRWQKLGYGKLESKPVRFGGFTGDGSWEELERMKGAVKRKQKSDQAAAKRGTLRPRA